MFISPHINSIEKSAQRTLQHTSESPQQSLRVPIILFQNNSEISRITFCDRTWMFSCMWGYPYTWMGEDTLYLLPENQKLNSRCKFVVKMVYSSNIFKIAGIIFLHEEQFCVRMSIAYLYNRIKRYIWYKVFPYLCIEWPKHQQSLILPLNHIKNQIILTLV